MIHSRSTPAVGPLFARTVDRRLEVEHRITSDQVSWVFSRIALSVLAIGLWMCAIPATALEPAEPAQVGLSAKKLAAITKYAEREVQAGRIPGAVLLIARHGRVGYAQAVGMSDLESAEPMKLDSLFRIASMTKAITSAAVMMLHEDGLLDLADPLSKHLPEFENPRVLIDAQGTSIEMRPARRTPTIHDLLTHTSGLTYGWFGPEKLDALYRERRLPDLFVPIDETIGDRVRRLAEIPLKSEPGSAWEYGLSLDVLGRVIEVVSGLTLEQFFHERFFRPLRMTDTFFYVPDGKLDRLASLYTVDDDKALIKVGATPTKALFLNFTADYCHAGARKFFSGGGGLVSTAGDYARFLQMLLNRGELDGVRILEPRTVELMTRNQIGELTIPFPGHGDGFGYGFGVLTERGKADDDASVGTYSWGGVFNTYYWVDPQQEMIGVLMTQIFPYGHLDFRTEFKRLAYEAIDDSGFRRVSWYEKGDEHANPHFAGRQLRVNAPEASVHERFAERSETRSGGMARILIDEDLRSIRRADLYCEVWGGHPGTANKRVSVNGRGLYPFPRVGTEDGHCAHEYSIFNLRPTDLVRGYNSLQFACDAGTTFWGHYIVDNAALEIGLRPDDQALVDAGLADFDVAVQAVPTANVAGFELRLTGEEANLSAVARVDYQAEFTGYDENGDGWRTDWHGMTKGREPHGWLGSSEKAPFGIVWNTAMTPPQKRVAVRAEVRFRGIDDIVYATPILRGLEIAERPDSLVSIVHATDLPKPFWSRAGRKRSCVIQLEDDPSDFGAVELHVVAWTGGAGSVAKYFTLNGRHFPIAEGSGHEVVYSRLPVDPAILVAGVNRIELLSDSEHHGIEILAPGPALVIRRKIPGKVVLTEDAFDASAGGLPCYKIETPGATYFLEKSGAGLSSLIDRDGVDWIGFHPRPNSGSAGEYRGFPNAVHKQAGSFFHPKNVGTDPSETKVEHADGARVSIKVTSNNHLWEGRYDFFPTHCTFTMTKMPSDRKYWFLYEGTPGGEYGDDDWWMTSRVSEKNPLTTKHHDDIPAPEWIAFGDRKCDRALFLFHHQDDSHPDRFYPMQRNMTVFGFGRAGVEKYLDTVPQSVSIGFVESAEHPIIGRRIAELASGSSGS